MIVGQDAAECGANVRQRRSCSRVRLLTTAAPLLGCFRQLNGERLSWRLTPCSLAASTFTVRPVRTTQEPGADLDQGSLVGENGDRGTPFWPPA